MNVYGNNADVNIEDEDDKEELEDGTLSDEEETELHIGTGEKRHECAMCEWEENSQDYFCIPEIRDRFYNILRNNMLSEDLMQNCIKASTFYNEQIVKQINSKLDDLNRRRHQDGEPPYKEYKEIRSGVLYYHQRYHRRTPQSILIDSMEHNASLLKHVRGKQLVKKKPGTDNVIIDAKGVALFVNLQKLQNDTIRLLQSLKDGK
jgi:hypothetical protein